MNMQRMSSDLRDKIGSIIYFNYFGEGYKGTLNYVDDSNKRLSILNVYLTEINEPYVGCMEIYPTDFEDKKFFIESIENKRKNRNNESSLKNRKDEIDEEILNTSNISILKQSFNCVNKKNDKHYFEETWETENSANEVKSTSSDVSSLKCPFGIITDIDSVVSILDFQSKKSEQIGLRVFANGDKLSLICLIINDFIWCFDFLTIKKQSNENAKLLMDKIEAILSNSNIIKVFHKHNTIVKFFSSRIRNYVDLDVCFKQLYQDQFGINVKSDSNLKKLIELYTDDFINDKHYENLNWGQRPLDLHHKSVFTKETKHLIELYIKYLELNKSIKKLNLLLNVFDEDKKKCDKEIQNGNRTISIDKNNNFLTQNSIQIPFTKTTRLSELMERSRKKSSTKSEEKYLNNNSLNQNGTNPKKSSR